MKTIFEKIALGIPKILLPSNTTDLKKWSVIACDQYTSHMKYWEDTADFVGDSPSTLNITLPEVFLETDREKLLIKNIHSTMETYLNNGTLEESGPAIFLCERTTSSDETQRKGLICCLDLEKYDYSKKSKSLIRPTEGTIVDRIPPRIKVREKACLETPHIMVLIDDPKLSVIEPLFEMEKENIYDFQLMNNSGAIQGFKIENKNAVSKLAENLSSLIDPENYKKRYNLDSAENPLLFAMGDGNHSFATAKAWWERVKKESNGDVMNHPARWALVEIVNIHDKSIAFEPIHRVIFDIEPQSVIDEFIAFWKNRGSKIKIELTDHLKDVEADSETCHEIAFSFQNKNGIISIENPQKNIAAGDLQDAINDLCERKSGIKVDYIHGTEHVKELSSQKGNLGFLLPPVSKESFFKSIIMDGALPRKSFSMGEADDKRFYMECRKIIP